MAKSDGRDKGKRPAINRAREKFMTDQTTRYDYNEFKKQCEDGIEKIEAQLHELNKNKVDSKDLVKKAINNLSMIGGLSRCWSPDQQPAYAI